MLLTNNTFINASSQSNFIYEKQSNYIKHDQLFKQLIRIFFSEFFKVFYPNIHKQIDFKTITFLSEEVYTATYKGEKIILDLVVKVTTKENDYPVIIHIEPQSYIQTDFNSRIFKYFSLLYNKFKRPILPIAIFSYDQSWEESEFISNVEVLRFNYLTLHLRKKNWRKFSNIENPVSATLLSLMNYSYDERIHVKFAFLNILAKLKLSKEMNSLLIGFFESYLQLNEEEEDLLMEEARKLDHADEILELPISYEEKGKEIGKEIGRKEEKRQIALKLLRENVDDELIMKVTQLNKEEIEQLKQQLL